jgi:hypothetical protein
MPITIGNSLSFCGRALSREDLDLIRQVTQDCSRLSLTELSRTVCELLDWRRANGALKTRVCYGFLQRLQARGWLTSLPPLRLTSPRRPRTLTLDSASDPGAPLDGPLRPYLPLEFLLVQTPSDRRLFHQYLQRYHYLGYRVPYGAQLRYWVRSQQPPFPLLACLLFTSAAWKMAPRDTWIGWSDTARQANLPQVINHSRFLILPWVRIRYLASPLLAQAARQLPQDWRACYQVQPLLLETLVDAARFPGTCYRAANWIEVGITQGRGRMDRTGQAQGRSPKHIFLYPLYHQTRQLLAREPCSSPGVTHEPA